MTSMKKAALILKTLLSLWIVYHIIVIVIMPNAGGYLGRVTSRYIAPYANIFGVNVGWNFFSPDPAHTMYIRYMVYFNNDSGEDEKEPIEGYFPAQKNQRNDSIFNSRELYVMRFMIINPKHLKYLFGPWLCRQYPGATSVDMEHVIETVPFLDQVVMKKTEAVSSMSDELQFSAQRYKCGSGEDEVDL
ncbi:hypothetical protein [Bdellovibrio sp. HCB2-146]|uniref:hypothetical protein n=1 Tax=Bdellovibrio sp. HCB2-146 TaxID=3394362 RepID=UPI0039BD695B